MEPVSQHKLDQLQSEIDFQRMTLDRKKARVKAMRSEHVLMRDQLEYIRKQVASKREEVRAREVILSDLNEGGGRASKLKLISSEKDRKRNEFEIQISTQIQNFIDSHPGLLDCKPGMPTSITVKYLKGTIDGELDSLDNSTLQEAKFRINSTTTFLELKSLACSFWGIEQIDTVSLRESNLAMLDLYDAEFVQEMLYKELLNNELYLFRINNQALVSFPQQEDCYVESAAERRTKPKKIKGSSIPKSDLPYLDSELEVMYKEFEAAYQGLRSFREPPDEDVEEFIKSRTSRRYASFTITIVLILILAFSLGAVLCRRNVPRDFWIQAGISSQLLENFKGDSNFFDISTITELNYFMTKVFAPLFFVPDSYTVIEPLVPRYEIIGPIRLRQQRVEFTDCTQDSYDIEGPCIEMGYNDDTKETDTIESGGWKYTDASENDIKSIVTSIQVTGQLNSYDGGGYVVDFPPTTTISEFDKAYTKMLDNGWYTIQSQSLFVTAIMYSPNYDIWINVTIVKPP